MTRILFLWSSIAAEVKVKKKAAHGSTWNAWPHHINASSIYAWLITKFCSFFLSLCKTHGNKNRVLLKYGVLKELMRMWFAIHDRCWFRLINYCLCIWIMNDPWSFECLKNVFTKCSIVRQHSKDWRADTHFCIIIDVWLHFFFQFYSLIVDCLLWHFYFFHVSSASSERKIRYPTKNASFHLPKRERE